MPTLILAAGTGAGTSTDVIIAPGETAALGLFRDDEAYIEADAVCPILRLDPNGDYNPTGLKLTGINPNLVIIAAGTYHVRRPAGLQKATGVQMD